MQFWKDIELGEKLLIVGVTIFYVGFILMFANPTALGIFLNIPGVMWTMATGLMVCLLGIISMFTRRTRRNRWLNVVGIISIFAMMGIIVPFSGMAIMEMFTGGTGQNAFEITGLNLGSVEAKIAAICLIFVFALLLHPLGRMVMGLTRFQR